MLNAIVSPRTRGPWRGPPPPTLSIVSAEELYYEYGHKGSPFEKRKSVFQFLYILKQNPSFDNAQSETHADKCDCSVWEEFSTCLDYFLELADELDFEGRLNKYKHTRQYRYLVTLIGDCFPVGSIGDIINDVLFQPKYEDEVYKLLLLIDDLGMYRWVGGLACGVRSTTRASSRSMGHKSPT